MQDLRSRLRSSRISVSTVLLLLSSGLSACTRRQTDEEQIRAIFVDAARAAEERKAGDVVRRLSEAFEGEGLDKRGVKQLVAFHLLQGSWVAITITGDDVRVEGDAAAAAVDVAMVRSGKGRALAELLPENATVYRLGARLRRTAEGWTVTTATWRPISLEEATAGPRAGSATAP